MAQSEKMEQDNLIPIDCPYPANAVTINGSKLNYIESGQGDPVLFLHGMPTSSYLWRNIFPALSDQAHCIAPDLIGMGQSDKPDIAYTVYDHIDYIEQFIEQLELKDITLVVHGWGSVIGLDIAKRHHHKIKALVFFESHIRPVTDWDMLSLPVQQFASLLDRPETSYRAIVEQNYLIKKLLPNGIMRQLRPQELERYEAPFSTTESRKPLWQYVQELPLGQADNDVIDLISSYSDWLQQSTVPKLLLYAMPGFITTMETVQWAVSNLSELTVIELPYALHFAQESVPHLFCQNLREWYETQVR